MVLVDLGVSSPQLDMAERGFSLKRDGPLDMRMDESGTRTAADIVNHASEKELARIIETYGEEPRATAAQLHTQSVYTGRYTQRMSLPRSYCQPIVARIEDTSRHAHIFKQSESRLMMSCRKSKGSCHSCQICYARADEW